VAQSKESNVWFAVYMTRLADKIPKLIAQIDAGEMESVPISEVLGLFDDVRTFFDSKVYVGQFSVANLGNIRGRHDVDRAYKPNSLLARNDLTRILRWVNETLAEKHVPAAAPTGRRLEDRLVQLIEISLRKNAMPPLRISMGGLIGKYDDATITEEPHNYNIVLFPQSDAPTILSLGREGHASRVYFERVLSDLRNHPAYIKERGSKKAPTTSTRGSGTETDKAEFSKIREHIATHAQLDATIADDRTEIMLRSHPEFHAIITYSPKQEALATKVIGSIDGFLHRGDRYLHLLDTIQCGENMDLSYAQ